MYSANLGCSWKPPVVLDKSFVQGISRTKMHALASTHRLLISEALLYELLSNPADCRCCFLKFPSSDNPVDLVMHVGGYLRKEVDTRRPAPKPSERIKNFRFQFNSRLLNANYELPLDAAQEIARQHDVLISDVQTMKELALTMFQFFPNAFVGNDFQCKAARADAERLITQKSGSLLNFYGQLRAPKNERRFPPARYLSEEWALYRSLQVLFLFSLDLYARYGNTLRAPLSQKTEEKIEHDVLDAQYLLIGVLEGSFATDELKLRRWFSLLRPDGHLFGNGI